MKKVLIGCGAGLFLCCAAIVGIIVAGFVMIDVPATNAKFDEGQAFGRTTDQEGCVSEGLKRARALGADTDFERSVMNRSFVSGCFQTSAPRADFCRDVPPAMKEITVTDENRKYKAVACERLGFGRGHVACKMVINAKADFCWAGGKSSSSYQNIFEKQAGAEIFAFSDGREIEP